MLKAFDAVEDAPMPSSTTGTITWCPGDGSLCTDNATRPWPITPHASSWRTTLTFGHFDASTHFRDQQKEENGPVWKSTGHLRAALGTPEFASHLANYRDGTSPTRTCTRSSRSRGRAPCPDGLGKLTVKNLDSYVV
ncbi:hypothetical protein [Streptomyces sp. NPDC003015]